MNLHRPRLAGFFAPLLLVGGCAWSDNSLHGTSRVLNRNLQAQLAPDIKSGVVALQPMPDGARIIILKPAQSSVDTSSLDDTIGDIRASVIEGLLDPTLMRIAVSDTSDSPVEVRNVQVRHVTDYFRSHLLGSTLVPEDLPDPPPAATAAAPAGVTIAIAVACPPHGSSGYGSGAVSPACN